MIDIATTQLKASVNIGNICQHLLNSVFDSRQNFAEARYNYTVHTIFIN